MVPMVDNLCYEATTGSLWRKHFVSIVCFQKENKNQIWSESDSFHGSLHILYSLNSGEAKQKYNTLSFLRLTVKKNLTPLTSCNSVQWKGRHGCPWLPKLHGRAKVMMTASLGVNKQMPLICMYLYVLQRSGGEALLAPVDTSNHRFTWVGVD